MRLQFRIDFFIIENLEIRYFIEKCFLFIRGSQTLPTPLSKLRSQLTAKRPHVCSSLVTGELKAVCVQLAGLAV